nr:DUF6751 family protein [uncultured Merdimonas sp.]
MNPNYIHTITVYNCLRAEDNSSSMKDIWQKTVLHDCYYKNVIGRVDSEKSSSMQNVYTARIPESQAYLPYHEWIELSEESRKSHFTFSLGDIVIKGECTDEITGTKPNTATEILQRHKPDAFKVTDFSDNTAHRMSKHYRVGG